MPQLPTLPVEPSVLLLWMDLIGIFIFGLTGGTLAVRHRLDLFGVLVLAMVCALAGGVIRDLMLGAVPPATFRDDRYLWSALASGLVAFVAHPLIEKVSRPVMVLDAAGLGIFAVAGCQKALAFGLAPLPAALLAVVTAIGGGVLRDMLINEIPRVLREEIYAVAALLAAVVVIVGAKLGLPDLPVAVAGALAAFMLRVVSVRCKWNAPRAPWS
ncbi:MAG TPA: trimeric intracellular cation channel family protein [Azospirillum sp.]|nr:trimeric intracellular cation channel family protein [Azospirillum sp.]